MTEEDAVRAGLVKALDDLRVQKLPSLLESTTDLAGKTIRAACEGSNRCLLVFADDTAMFLEAHAGYECDPELTIETHLDSKDFLEELFIAGIPEAKIARDEVGMLEARLKVDLEVWLANARERQERYDFEKAKADYERLRSKYEPETPTASATP
jgi:hypothetical protein